MNQKNFEESGETAPLVWELGLLIEPGAGLGPMNMAVDEALLLSVNQPVLRIYSWAAPAVSFGCFVKYEEVTKQGGRTLVRRWTGGGVVEHGGDFTYSLILPAGREAAACSSAQSYREIHGALGRALRAAGVEAGFAPETPAGLGGVCFAQPVAYDLMLGGRKIAGAAQRRSRHGRLHQGSVQAALPEEFPSLLAGALAGKVTPFSPSAAVLELAARLEREKYGTDAWLKRL